MRRVKKQTLFKYVFVKARFDPKMYLQSQVRARNEHLRNHNRLTISYVSGSKIVHISESKNISGRCESNLRISFYVWNKSILYDPIWKWAM